MELMLHESDAKQVVELDGMTSVRHIPALHYAPLGALAPTGHFPVILIIGFLVYMLPSVANKPSHPVSTPGPHLHLV